MRDEREEDLVPVDKKLLAQFVQASEEKKEAAAAEKKASARMKEVEQTILDQFTEEGISSMKVTVESELDDADITKTKLALLMEDVELPPEKVQAIAARLFEKPSIKKTLFIGSRIWANPKIDDPDRDKANDAEYERACRALEANGFGEYVQERFNVISLSSAIKEEVENGTIPVGEAFDGTIVVKEKFQLNARAAK